jgi:hypothetical protein
MWAKSEEAAEAAFAGEGIYETPEEGLEPPTR